MTTQALSIPSPSIEVATASSLPRAPLALPRFGVVISGFQFVLPERVLCDFMLCPQLFAMPKAPPRLVGLVHSRGFAIPVFDAVRDFTKRISLKLEDPLLIVGHGGQAGALLVESPPRLLNEIGTPLNKLNANLEAIGAAPWNSGHPVFEGLTGDAYLTRPAADSEFQVKENVKQEAANGKSLWWSIDFKSLFERLSQLKGE